jgi:hypothetical protein
MKHILSRGQTHTLTLNNTNHPFRRCTALCRGLRSNAALKSLSIQFGDIGPIGGTAIADMLA